MSTIQMDNWRYVVQFGKLAAYIHSLDSDNIQQTIKVDLHLQRVLNFQIVINFHFHEEYKTNNIEVTKIPMNTNM